MNSTATLRPIGTTFEFCYRPSEMTTDVKRGTYPLIITYKVVAHVDIWPDGIAEEIVAIGQRFYSLEGKHVTT